MYVAKALGRLPVSVTLIDRRNFHLFQPLLYQVATGGLSPGEIASPLRVVLRNHRNTEVLLGEVVDLDVANRRVIMRDGEVSYDTLVVATGATHHYFGNDQWEALAPGLKTIENATEIRSRLLLAFERAEREHNAEERRAWLNFVIVGGGPTGVELAGAIKELAVDVIPRDFRVADTRRARVLLIEAGPRLLPAFREDSSARALAQLHALGVEVRLGAPVTQVLPDGVEAGSDFIRSYNVIWAAGVKAAPLVTRLAIPVGPGGRVAVAPDCSLPAHPEVFVIGDAASLTDTAGRQVPGVSQGALQMGRYVAGVIDAEVRGRSGARAAGFRYHDYGSMATVGKSRAVVEIGPLRFGGFLAWLAWLALHITVLVGFRNRVAVLVSWIYGYVFMRRGSRLITRSQPPAMLPCPPPGAPERPS